MICLWFLVLLYLFSDWLLAVACSRFENIVELALSSCIFHACMFANVLFSVACYLVGGLGRSLGLQFCILLGCRLPSRDISAFFDLLIHSDSPWSKICV